MKLGHVAVLGFLALPLIGFLLPKHTDASAPTQVDVVNRPTVQVGNTPSVNVSNTPNVNVANQVGIASLPSIQIASGSVSVSSLPTVQLGGGSVSVSNTAQAPIPTITAADFNPIEVSGNCTFAVNASTCTQDGFYSVPSGFTAVITSFTGVCGLGTNDVPIAAAQLYTQWAGSTQTLTVPATNTGGGYIAFGLFSTTTTFYAAGGTSITVGILAGGSQGGQFTDNCAYAISGYLTPAA
jgi:hypothetical protein